MTVCSVLYAEKITVSGTVTDNAGKALEGVKVTFAQTKDLSVVTKADGAFTLTNATSLLLPRDLRTSYGISFRNNAIIFTNASEKVSGILSLYSINGRRKGKSIADCFLATAKLGGYLGRKRDSPPGNAVTWKGISRLHDLVIGFDLGTKFVGN